jgi:hypothetical protein
MIDMSSTEIAAFVMFGIAPWLMLVYYVFRNVR